MLNRKMFRDIRKNLSQFITIFLMVMIGITAYTGIESYMDGMKYTRDKFYDENNIQDLNVYGPNFTNEDLETIKKIDNVKNVERKLSVTGLTNNDKTLLLNFIESNKISKFYVVEGDKFDNDSGIWIDSYFAKENNIKVGDTILVKYEELKLNEKVRGLINIPDHLYDVRDASEVFPDREKFAIGYMSPKDITEDFIKHNVMKEMNIEDEEIFDMYMPDFNYKDYIVYNSVMVDVKAKKKIDKVRDEIEDKVDNAKAIVYNEDTASYVAYQGEIEEGETYVGVFSGLFIFIAMLSVITTMTRIVKKQRVQIGTLKALGFTNRKILFHYIGYGVWIAFFGCIAGMLAGYYGLGAKFMSLEAEMFEIPNARPYLNTSCFIVSLGVVLVIGLITYITGRSILKENPAETLRNKIPSVKSRTISITKKGFFKKLSFASKWNLRDILRNKIRTFMGIIGVTGCAMLIVFAFGMLDSLNFFIKLQFETIYNFDYKLVLKEDITDKELDNLYNKYGKHTSKSLQIEYIDSNDKREPNNIFVTDASNYVRFVDRDNNIIKQPKDNGVFVTFKLADTEGYKIGDKIKWHIYGEDKYYTSKIIGFNKDPQNQNITMTKKYLESLDIEYKPDAIYTNDNLSKIKEIKGVDTVQDINSLKSGTKNMLEAMNTMLGLMIFIAIALGSIIIYNLGILSYTEKEYQFATLKVLGFNGKQIKNIFIRQNNWIAIISVILGLPLGYYMADWMFKTAIEEHYDFAAHIEYMTYIIAAVGTFMTSYVISLLLTRKIKKIDMVTSLKGNE